ncbi:hypothetical protein F2Q70_00011478 [Brassica cretica]|uniref:Uncharacterized protein n=1 Tax=Brassica cretica TaxID=69181 RepID=A0A8S9LTW3_BRACR|nr:hypothetical protein F2Q70_00011478 [Brassica cretica]
MIGPGIWLEPGGFRDSALRSCKSTGCSFRSGDHNRTLAYLDPEVVWEPEGSLGMNPKVSSLDPKIWNPEELEGFFLRPEDLEPRGTVLRHPRQGYYRYLFGFHILPLGSWPLSSSYAVFYFCRKSLTGLKGAGVGVMTQVPGFAAFHVLKSRVFFTCILWGPRCALGCTGVLGSFDNILRLAHTHTHSCFMSHTRFGFFLWACPEVMPPLQRLARNRGLWRPDPARMPL